MAKRRAEGLDLDEDVVKKKPKLEENQTCILNSLPEELIQQILIRIPIRYLEQYAIATVCSEFARLTSDYLFWRSVCIYHWGENIAPLRYTDPSDLNYDAYIIPIEESSNRPNWRKYCIFRGHFQMAMQETNLALDKLGTEQAKLNEWADLNKIYIAQAIKTLGMREVGDIIENNDYFPFFCDVIASMHADQHFSKLIYKVIEALDTRVEKFSHLTHGLALVSLYEKYNGTLHNGYASELLHISSESFKQLVSKYSIISNIERAEYYLKRLVDAWIQFSYSTPEIVNEDFTLPGDSLYFPTRIAQALISDQTNETVAENLSQIIVEKAWKEYNDSEKDWKRKLVALTIAELNFRRVPTDVVLKMFRMGLDAFQDLREPVKICGIIFLNHASFEKHLNSSVELPSDVIIDTIIVLLHGMEILPGYKVELFAGMIGILLYCSEKPARTDLITEELFDRIHSVVLNVTPEMLMTTHESGLLNKLIVTLMRFSHAEKYYADYWSKYR